ncbi:MAG: hypothetical protein ACR2OU_13545 [Thermomicrobiales bacterium]
MEDWESASTLVSLKSELAELEKAPTFMEWELLNTAYSALILNFDELAEHLNLPNRDFKVALKLLEMDLSSEFYRIFTSKYFVA